MKHLSSLPCRRWGLVIATVLLASVGAHAQWQTQNFTLQPGWNAAYLHVDPSHDTIDALVPVEVNEIWYWNPEPSTLQFINSPQEPVDGGSQWLVWKRGKPEETTLGGLLGNAAYLVEVTGGSAISFSIKGKPVPPRYQWTTTGVNILGYSSPEGAAPTLENFLLARPNASLFDLEHFKYIGGDLSELNPGKVLNLRNENLDRGRAYWIRSKSGAFNRFFGSIEVSLQDLGGVRFGDNRSTYRIRIQNITKHDLDVTVSHLASEAPPNGQTAINDRPALLLRGALDPATLQYAFSDLNATPAVFSLKAAGDLNSSAEVVLGLDRSQLTGNAGDLFAGILRFTDSRGISQIDVPVSANKASLTGLWVGDAKISEVRHDLTYFARNADGATVFDDVGATTTLSNNITFGKTSRSLPLRMIVHVDDTGTARLMQRAYVGIVSNTIASVTIKEALLDQDHLASARRISAAHLPWSRANNPFAFTGTFARGQAISTTVTTAHDAQGANPFVHTYHPDHDNRNATFDASLARGLESYEIQRDVALSLDAPSGEFSNLTSGHREVTGTYAETITLKGKGSEQKQYAIRGSFRMTRFATIPELTTE